MCVHAADAVERVKHQRHVGTRHKRAQGGKIENGVQQREVVVGAVDDVDLEGAEARRAELRGVDLGKEDRVKRGKKRDEKGRDKKNQTRTKQHSLSSVNFLRKRK